MVIVNLHLFPAVFTTNAVNMTEPEVQNIIASFINTNLGVDKAK